MDFEFQLFKNGIVPNIIFGRGSYRQISKHRKIWENLYHTLENYRRNPIFFFDLNFLTKSAFGSFFQDYVSMIQYKLSL